jgi:hypothetical protein
MSLSLFRTEMAAAEEGPKAFCNPEAMVKDYLAPLDHFPSENGFLESGQLRVGPEVLRISPPSERLVAIGHDRFSVYTSLSHTPRRSSPRLGWWVSSQLERIGKDQDATKTVKSKRQYIERIRGFGLHPFGFGSKVKPGIYRLTIGIENKAGKLLTEYEEYYRAVRPELNLKLATDRRSFAPGEIGLLRVENYGTLTGTYYFDHRVWHVGDKVELPLPPQIYPAFLPFLHPGYASGCTWLRIPSDAPPGEYEVGMEAKPSLSSKRELLLTRFTIESL